MDFYSGDSKQDEVFAQIQDQDDTLNEIKSENKEDISINDDNSVNQIKNEVKQKQTHKGTQWDADFLRCEKDVMTDYLEHYDKGISVYMETRTIGVITEVDVHEWNLMDKTSKKMINLLEHNSKLVERFKEKITDDNKNVINKNNQLNFIESSLFSPKAEKKSSTKFA
jgi:hypothetical protein